MSETREEYRVCGNCGKRTDGICSLGQDGMSMCVASGLEAWEPAGRVVAQCTEKPDDTVRPGYTKMKFNRDQEGMPCDFCIHHVSGEVAYCITCGPENSNYDPCDMEVEPDEHELESASGHLFGHECEDCEHYKTDCDDEPCCHCFECSEFEPKQETDQDRLKRYLAEQKDTIKKNNQEPDLLSVNPVWFQNQSELYTQGYGPDNEDEPGHNIDDLVYRTPAKPQTGISKTQWLIRDECKQITETLLEKNRKYGDSAISPVRVFSKADPAEQINVRLDDKISRIMSGQTDDDEDVELDLIGYLVLKRVQRRIAE